MDGKDYRRSRVLYHIEAALEYLIALLFSGSFLAYLTASLGISDSLTGIISSIISLGCLFQLLAVLIRRKSVKRIVMWLSILNQTLFMLLYLLPLGDFVPGQVKVVLFVVMIIGAYLLYNLAFPKKISWLMSLVPDAERGKFTAIKEIISLIVGIAFSLGMGEVVDRFDAAGNSRGAFITGAVTIFVLMVLHTLCMGFSIEPVDKDHLTPRLREGIRRIWENRQMRSVVVVFLLYHLAAGSSSPFYGSYQIKELGLSQAVVWILAACGSLVRALVSVPLGKFADKMGFAKILRFCLMIFGVSFLCITVATPSNGLVCFLLYYIFTGVAMSGIGSAMMNLVFDYVQPEERADALAVTQAVGGVAGFCTTLCVSPLVSLIQNDGNRFWGIPIYAQQVTAIIAIVFTLVTLCYLHFAIIRKQEKEGKNV